VGAEVEVEEEEEEEEEAEPPASPRTKLVTALDAEGCTALHHACRQGHNHIVRLLLINGAIVDADESTDASTPLHWAAIKNNLEGVELLLNAGADRRLLNRWGYSALDNAKSKGHYGVIAQLTDDPSEKKAAEVQHSLERRLRPTDSEREGAQRSFMERIQVRVCTTAAPFLATQLRPSWPRSRASLATQPYASPFHRSLMPTPSRPHAHAFPSSCPRLPDVPVHPHAPVMVLHARVLRPSAPTARRARRWRRRCARRPRRSRGPKSRRRRA
jgi:hypothetical protein